MASVNKWIGIGNLGRDPEMRYLPDGTSIASLAVACTDKFKDKSGQMVEQTEWVRVGFFGRTAEVCGQYLKKGSQVYIEGSIRTRKYTDKEGVEKYATEIRGDRMQMLGGRSGDSGGGYESQQYGSNGSAPRSHSPGSSQHSGAAQRPAAGGGSNGFDDMDDDIPFGTASLALDVTWKKLGGLPE